MEIEYCGFLERVLGLSRVFVFAAFSAKHSVPPADR